MKIRYLGHSCVEIIGQHHILIDPNFTREPEPGVEYICITHAHNDHIGRVLDVSSGIVLASPDVCESAASLGVPRERLQPVSPGERVANIQILPGYSQTVGFVYTLMVLLFKRHLPESAGTPLSFLVEDEASLLHIGDAHEAPLEVRPDVFCMPWRTSPLNARSYKDALIRMATRFGAPYILPIHYDLVAHRSRPARTAWTGRGDGSGWKRLVQLPRKENGELIRARSHPHPVLPAGFDSFWATACPPRHWQGHSHAWQRPHRHHQHPARGGLSHRHPHFHSGHGKKRGGRVIGAPGAKNNIISPKEKRK